MARTFVWHRTRGPKRTEKNQLTTGRVRIEQVRSGIGHSRRMRLTLEALGLRHHQDVVEQQDSPSLRGQLKQVRHLVRVTPLAGEQRPAAQEKQAVPPAPKKVKAPATAPPRARTRRTSEKKSDGE